MTLLATRTTTLECLGASVLKLRELPRPHVALRVGLHPLEPIIERIRANGESKGLSVVFADLRGIEPKDVLWTVGTAIFRLVDPERPIRPRDQHPATAFRRLFSAVIRQDDDDYVLIVGPIDELEATPDEADDIYGALRASVVEFERRVQIVFLVRNDIIRKQVFWLKRPTMEFASFLDIVS